MEDSFLKIWVIIADLSKEEFFSRFYFLHKIKKLLWKIIDFYKKIKKDVFNLLKYILRVSYLDLHLKRFDDFENFNQCHHLHFGEVIDTDVVGSGFIPLYQLE